ncbi:methylenetetrahydrofolate reductase, partial [Nocardia cyriacigeorgica]|uniref:methylenetetrahydrofolate reductase n=1 Tax=Nocardia cyriacigeorgica TaxID=135487 RepID=UPI002457F88D
MPHGHRDPAYLAEIITAEGVEYAEELVRIVRDLGDFHVGVASFPQGHHRSPDVDLDTRFLAAKLRAGAEYSITQMFFDVDHYLR